jgi:hypothetical protein
MHLKLTSLSHCMTTGKWQRWSHVGAIAPPWFCKFSEVHILFRGNRNTNTRPLLNNSAESRQLTSNQSIRRHSKQRNPHSDSISPFCFSSSKWQCLRGYTSLTADGSALGMPHQSSCQPTKLSDCRKVSSCSARACKMAPLGWAARSATDYWCPEETCLKRGLSQTIFKFHLIK